MKGQSTPLADFFRGRNVAREQRVHMPLVCDQIGIIWVVGHRIAELVKVSEKTGRKLGLWWQNEGGAAVPRPHEPL
jgi:tRNA(Ile)-lysidine synthase